MSNEGEGSGYIKETYLLQISANLCRERGWRSEVGRRFWDEAGE